MERKKKISLTCGAVAMAIGLSCGLGFWLSARASSYTDTESYVAVGEIWDKESKTFNGDNLKILYKYLTGNKNATIEDVETLASSPVKASTIRSNVITEGVEGQTGYKTKDASQNVEVTLGGLTWQVCYLSEDKDGNAILTLWLSNSQQEAFEGREQDEGKYYGYYDGSLYSDWSSNWTGTNSFAMTYPAHLYGTSYIRAVTLNNGGEYATNNTTLAAAVEKDSKSAFAMFTMEEFGLTYYLVTPRNVSWQEEQSATNSISSGNWSYPNDAWGSNIPNTGTSSNGVLYKFYENTTGFSNYSEGGTNGRAQNDAWADDYLWLPSMTETGWSTGVHGMWGLNVYQRMNVDGKTIYPNAKVGEANGAAYNYSWLRSGYCNNASGA